MQAERCPLLREDVFDLLIISAPPSILPWSTERMRFLRRYYPSLPLSSIDCGSTLSTIDGSILSETSDQFENSLCVLSNITNQASANQSSTLMASYRQLKNTACDNFWMNCFKLISESDEALEQFVTCLSNFLFSQKASKKKNPIVHSILKLLLPNLFGKDREDILVDVQCLLTLSNPQDLLVRIRQLIKCPFIKSSIFPSRLELEKANSRFVVSLPRNTIDTNYDCCNDSFLSNYSFYCSDDDLVHFNRDEAAHCDVAFGRYTEQRSSVCDREARIQKSISYHSHITTCAKNWEDLNEMKIETETDAKLEAEMEQGANLAGKEEKESAHLGCRAIVAERKQFKRHSLGSYLVNHHSSSPDEARDSFNSYSRMDMDSPTYDYECVTPTAGLLHGGYSSCEDDDGDVELSMMCRDDSRMGSEERAESSSCSDSLMSQRTFSSLNHSVYDLDPQTPQASKFCSDWLPGTAISYAPSLFSSDSPLSTPIQNPTQNNTQAQSSRALFQESNNYGNFGVSCKTGWLEVKHLLTLKKRKLEAVPKRKFRRFWCCLKGTKLLLYTDINTSANINATPFNTINLDNCLVQPLPEHPRRENIIIVSTTYGDVYMIQCVSYNDMHVWTNTIHKVCGHSNALNKNSEDTVKLLKMDIERKEKLCMESKNSTTTEKYQCDIFRLKCYISSLKNEDLPNPKTLLCLVTKETKSQLSRLNCFSVCTVHALVTAQSVPQPKNQGSLERPKRTMFSLLRSKDSFSAKDDFAKNRNLKRRNSHAGKVDNHITSLDDSIVCSPAAKDQLAVWDHKEKGKLGRINLPRNQTTVIPVLPHTTVQDVLDRCCRKRSLDPKDHFIRVKQFERWLVPQPRSLLTNYTCESIELCIKEYKSVHLGKTAPNDPYGFSFKMHADPNQGNSRLFVLDVIPKSVAEKNGIAQGDEIIEIDSLPVSSIDQNLIDFHLKKKDSLSMLIRSLRPSRYSNSTCDVCGKPKTSTDEQSMSCGSASLDQSTNTTSTFQRLAKISDELFATEKQYVDDLETLICDYLTPIVQSNLVLHSKIQQLYSAAVNIQKVQRRFFTDLKAVYPEGSSLELTSNSLEGLADTLVPCMESLNQHVAFFKIYGSYCALHNSALEIFREASSDPEFKALMESINPLNDQSRNIQSFMIKPLQRILKYKLFIRQIADYYPSDLDGYTVIEETFENVDKLGSHINEMQRVYEDYNQTFEQLLAEQAIIRER